MITLDSSSLVELIAGRRLELEVGTLPLEVRKHLGCSKDTIYLSSESAKHIMLDHPDIGLKEMLALPEMLEVGLWLADRKPTHAVVSSKVHEFRYKIVVKVTVDRGRTYIQTAHRTAKRQTASLISRGIVLRNHW